MITLKDTTVADFGHTCLYYTHTIRQNFVESKGRRMCGIDALWHESVLAVRTSDRTRQDRALYAPSACRIELLAAVHGYFVKLPNAMDCIHGKITKKDFRNIFKAKSACQYWEYIYLKNQENDGKIKENLKWIYKRLDKVIQVLESKIYED